MQSHRPTISGTNHVAAACHFLAAEAGFRILEAGGNAIDAGVAAGMTLSVAEPEFVSFGGVAPIILYSAKEQRVVTVSGLGTWPKALDKTLFQRQHGGSIPPGILRTVVPAAPDAWITALTHWGTMSFAEVAAPAIALARRGFAVDPLLSELLTEHEPQFRAHPSSAAVYMPRGRAPLPGEVFVQNDLANTIQYMVDQETAARSKGREAAIAAARDAFYRGDIAQRIVRFQKENGGFLSAEDMAAYRSGIEPPVQAPFNGIDVYTCGPWCQGPSLLQMLALLDAGELRGLGQNSPGYIHRLTEAVKLAFADRERYYGDPRMIDVPMDALLSADYSALRRKLIRSDRAWPEMPPAGTPEELGVAVAGKPGVLKPQAAWRQPDLDTSYVCVVDKEGNAFSATPSDGTTYHAPVVPGLGLVPSPRGCQSWADPDHPSGVAPGKRPRLTPNPALAIQPGRMKMTFGTPGSDVQTQAMLQVFLNVTLFGMDPQAAVEAPRFASYSFPSSFEPHDYHPGLLRLEGRIDKATAAALEGLGHRIDWWPDWSHWAGAVCTIRTDEATGVRAAGADPRRSSYAVGW